MNNRGSTLAIVIIISSVLIIFAFSLGSLSLSETKHVIYQEKKLQAYYIARAGAESATRWITSNPKEFLKELRGNNGILVGESNNYFDVGSFNLTITGELSKVKVEAIGKVENGVDNNGNIRYVKDTVTMVLRGKESKPKTNTYALHAKESITIDGKVVGDIETNENGEVIKNESAILDGQAIESDVEFTVGDFPEFPTDLDYKGDLTKSNNLTIDNDCNYSTIEINGNNTLNINVNGGVREVRVDDLYLNSNLDIQLRGKGTVKLYIGKFSNLKGTINNPINSDVKLEIYHSGTELLDFKEQSIMNASIYTNSSVINFGNNTLFTGSIISNRPTLEIRSQQRENLGSVLIYAPQSDINIVNTTLTGGIIGNTISIDSDSVINFSEEEMPGPTQTGEGSSISFTTQWD